jgi:trehalose 6-phosphate phosphatase
MSAWTLVYDGLDPATERRRETLCTLGNGYLATRGAAPEHVADDVHYPGTYVAGLYDRLTDVVAGQTVENESLVNLPNWLPVTLRVEGGPWLGERGVEVLEHHVELDIRRGILLRRSRFRDPDGRVVLLAQRRLVHLRDEHLAALETTVVAENWAGTLRLRSGIDGGVRNCGVARYHALDGRHLHQHVVDAPAPETVRLLVETRTSRIRIATAARTQAWLDGSPVSGDWQVVADDESVWLEREVAVQPGQHLLVEKVAAVCTSRDRAISEPGLEVASWTARAPRFESLRSSHVLAWAQLWQRFHLAFDSDERTLQICRLHLFHLLQTTSPRSVDLDAGVPARGLHGEAYRGHVLWDELFAVPMLSLRLPVLTRALLMYRYRRLPEARAAARDAGRSGAMYPWQSGSNGREESQRLHLNPLSGNWVQDPTALQRHVGLAVAYNVWQYHEATGDEEFLVDHGAEMILEVARFFAHAATYDHSRDRYSIRGVMGPDEFHTGYPDAAVPGIDDNAYTNVMAAWVLTRALEALETLPGRRRDELVRVLGLHPAELDRFDAVSRRLTVPFHDGVISQFQGYERLEELDWAGYRERYGDLQRLDRILEAEGGDPNRYKASKQADVLMLFYLLTADELGELLARLGYTLAPDTIPRTVDYYLARTTHGSTLSAVVHAWVLARARRASAVEFLHRALNSDVTDIQGGTTAEGIHLAAMAGSVDLLQRCFTGLEIRGGTLWLNPAWPPQLGTLELDLVYRTVPLTLRVSGTGVRVRSEPGANRVVQVGCRGEVVQLRPGGSVDFPLTRP